MSVVSLTTQSIGKVAVAMGGHAAEREISLLSGQAVLAGLAEAGIDAVQFDTASSSLSALKEMAVDRVFNVMHGRGGEDGQLQGALELLGLPYTGSGVLGSALGMDKWRTKLCWLSDGIPTPKWHMLNGLGDLKVCEKKLGFPVIVKPILEGSSLGMAKANNVKQLAEAYLEAAKFGCDVMAEQWIEGAEYTVAILGADALPMIRLETPHDFYDYDAKYNANSTQYHCPCGLEESKELELQALALRAFRVVGGSGWGRVDLMLDVQGNAWFLEINTVPGMTNHSLVPMAAKQAGLSFPALTRAIIEISMSDAEAVNERFA